MNDIEKGLDRLAEKLPEGYEVQLCVERGAGWLQVITPEGGIVPIEGDSETCWAMAMADALTFCLLDSEGDRKPIRYANPIPFSLWIGARETSMEHPLDWTMLCGGEVGSFARDHFREDYRWRPIAIKLLPHPKPKPIRYERPAPFVLWVGERETGRRFPLLRSGSLRWPPIAIKLLPQKPRPIRYANPTPFTLWVEGFAWWTEGIYVSNRKRYEFAGLEIGRIARAAHRGKGNRHFTGLPTIAIKLLPKTKRHW